MKSIQSELGACFKQKSFQQTSLAGWRLSIPTTAIFLVLVTSFNFATSANANDDYHVQRLLDVQEKVSAVVSKNMNACVAISDGVGYGSGVIVSPDGLVLTAGHVMAEDGEYEVILPTGQTVKAKPLGKNLDLDSGMVQITEPGPWPYVEISKTRTFQPGEWVVSLGHSGGFELGRKPPVRTGRILSRQKHQILTDAVLIGGDSGGPLFDLSGQLIAIHSSIGDSVSENRHVTIDYFERDWSRLRSGESWGSLPELNEPGKTKRRGKIGVQIDREAPNARIRTVKEGTPADEAGIRVGDVVLTFDRTRIIDGPHLIEVIRRKRAGQVFSMTIFRNGRAIKLEIQLR
jgi:serine protease Do